MNQIIIACGLESEQLDMLAAALPEGYTLRVEDWVYFAVSNSSSCCDLQIEATPDGAEMPHRVL